MLPGPYDLATAFRFFPNVEPENRVAILRELHRRLDDSGRLVFNVHGNLRSVRRITLFLRRITGGGTFPQMPPAEVQAMAAAGGFEVERVYGYGILPRSLYRTFLRPMASALDGPVLM